MKVEILSRKLITPSSPTPQHLRNLKISFLDQLFPPNYYVSSIFYYPSSSKEDGVSIAENLGKQLQKSLSEILTLYYPFAGRYNDEDLLVDCDDEGAEYLEAQVSGCLSQLLKEAELETQLRNELAPSFIQPDKSPPVMVQFNMFECGGVAIGISMTHKIVDGFTFFTFINAWGTASRTTIEEVRSPSFQLASLCPAKELSAIKTAVPRSVGDSKIVERRFVFDGRAISNLKEIANTDGSQLLKRRPTRVEVVTAHIWRTLIRLSQVRDGCLRPSFIAHSVNMRGRTNISIPHNACGNFGTMFIAQFIPDGDSTVELHDVVNWVHEGAGSTMAECAKASNGDDIFSILTNMMQKIKEIFENTEADVHMFVSWCQFRMYEVDFGWGKPAWVSNVHVPMEMIFLMDTRDGEGIEAWVSLKESSMLLFQQILDSI